jgi:hypothetical protein
MGAQEEEVGIPASDEKANARCDCQPVVALGIGEIMRWTWQVKAIASLQMRKPKFTLAWHSRCDTFHLQ